MGDGRRRKRKLTQSSLRSAEDKERKSRQNLCGNAAVLPLQSNDLDEAKTKMRAGYAAVLELGFGERLDCTGEERGGGAG